MKMAKASKADLEMAMHLTTAFDSLTGHYPSMPPGLCSKTGDCREDRFDCDDDKQCGTVLRHLLAIAKNANLMQVTFGMTVLLDPGNKMVNPDADTLEHHPGTVAALAAMSASSE